MRLKNKIFVVFLISIIFSQTPISTPSTHAFWGEFVQENYHFILKKIDDTITGTILSTLKQQAMKMITGQMEKLIGGGAGSGGAKFITDWKDYIVKKPKDETKVYMNDYLSQITKGRGSSTGYVGKSSAPGGSLSSGMKGAKLSEGFGGNYSSQLVNMAKKKVVDPKTPQMTYEGDPSQMFSSGTFKNMNHFLSGINNPWSFEMHTAAEKKKKDEENTRIATAKAIANNGFKSVGEKEKASAKGKESISMPGSLVKDMAANAQDLGNKILAGATHPEEIITAMVSQMMSKAMQMGISQVQSMVGKEIGGMISGKMNDLVKKEGPGAIFKTSNSSSATTPNATNQSGSSSRASVPPPVRNF